MSIMGVIGLLVVIFAIAGLIAIPDPEPKRPVVLGKTVQGDPVALTANTATETVAGLFGVLAILAFVAGIALTILVGSAIPAAAGFAVTLVCMLLAWAFTPESRNDYGC